ncbi:hypothetical protein [Caballeronia sp. DA-9]|uniref:hypothetical protein n=1 Tax=Caballeronia sp. DA-9 TaxID=3436237 RepID=UPI003F66C995
MTEQKIDSWAVTVNVNNEDVLTIGHSHVSGIADFDDVAPIVRTCAAHLLSFIGEGPDHVGNHIAMSCAILQAATRDTASADAVDAQRYRWLLDHPEHVEYGDFYDRTWLGPMATVSDAIDAAIAASAPKKTNEYKYEQLVPGNGWIEISENGYRAAICDPKAKIRIAPKGDGND